jgi:hypothetical protein
VQNGLLKTVLVDQSSPWIKATTLAIVSPSEENLHRSGSMPENASRIARDPDMVPNRNFPQSPDLPVTWNDL